MRSFLNVLYRRILYKIPLKRLLVLLAVFAVLFACFSSASYTNNSAGALNLTAKQIFVTGKDWANNADTDTFCMMNLNSSPCNFTATNPVNGETVTIDSARHVGCLTGIDTSLGISVKNNGNSSCNGYNLWLKADDFFHDTWTTLQCQTEYNLIPVESVDENYCTSNNLCPTYDCPINPIGTGVLSNLYINNILHIGAPNIIMNIPDEIDWDYAYTAGGQNMNIDVVGYNVDYEKIDSIVAFQNYKPSSEDFQKIIGLLAPYTKIIVFFVFLFIIWAWIKKPFKSKKL